MKKEYISVELSRTAAAAFYKLTNYSRTAPLLSYIYTSNTDREQRRGHHVSHGFEV